MSQKINNKTKNDIKPTVKGIVDLPYKIHGNHVKVAKVLLNKNDNNTHQNIETFVNKLLANLRGKNINTFQIQAQFSSGKNYSINSFTDINADFVMNDFNALYVDVGDIEQLNNFFS